MRPARIGVNLLWLVPGVVGGSEEYTVRLLDAFADRAEDHPDLHLTLLVNRRTALAHRPLLARYDHVVAPIAGGGKALRVAAEATWLAATARRAGFELVHHCGGTMPALRLTPGLVTIHDLQPLAFPENFSAPKRAYLHAAIPPSARAARRVVVLTDWVRRDVVARLGVEEARVDVVPPGVGATDTPAGPPDPAAAAAALGRLGLAGRPYFLYPAITYPHKNHATLVRALAPVAARHPGVALVLTGGQGPSEGELAALVGELGLGGNVVRPGRIPAADLDALYRGAVALAFPSRYEGFGLPILEAMSRSCPVLASRGGSLPEVVGSAGVLLDPDDVAGWAEAMAALLASPDQRAAWAARGLARAGDFPWSASAHRLEVVYRSALVAEGSTAR